MHLDDSTIIELFFERSERAITELSEKYSETCTRIACNILGNEADAQECVNDTLLGVWNRIPPEKPQPLSAYVFRITRNLAIKKYRTNTAKKRNSFYDLAVDELVNCLTLSDRTVENEVDFERLSEEINNFLHLESRENRIIFVKRYWFGESITEIAREMNSTKHNISVKLSRTRQKLKKHLTEKGFEI